MQDTVTLTNDNSSPRGTVRYVAPEMTVKGDGHRRRAGRKTDIWSLGCVIIHMLTGKPPEIVTDAGDALHPNLGIYHKYFQGGFW